MKVALFCGGSVFAVALGLCASPAAAATATAEATSPGVVGEITVVAEKREQSLQTVPVAISAFSAEQRKLIGIAIIQDLADFSPSLNWTDIDDRVYIRGIGRNSDNLNNTSGVAIYYNGIYYGANAAIEQQKSDLFIGNIEVDNGPQNTLHGSNADGGVVSFTSQRPTDTLYGEVRVGVANYETYFVESVVSGPINDHLKFRLGGNFTEQRGGFFNNLDGSPQGGNLVLGGSGETHYLEGQLEGHWDHLDAWIQASSGNFIANTHGAAALGNFPATPFNGADGLTPSGFYGLCGLPGFAATANGAGCAGGPPIVPGSVVTRFITADQFPGNNPGNVNIRDFINEDNTRNSMTGDVQISAHVTYHLPSLDISYLGGYQNFHYVLHIANQPISGIDAGVVSFQEAGAPTAAAAFLCTSAGFTLAACQAPLTINPTPNFLTFNEYDQAFSHELDFTSTGASPFQYIGGVYWYRERWNQPVQADSMTAQPQMGAPMYSNLLGGACPGGAFAVCAAPLNPDFAGSSENTAITYDSVAVFFQGSYKFNDEWKITGGFRYTSDHKEGWQTWRVVGFTDIFGAPEFGSATPAFDITQLAACSPAAAPLCLGPYPGAGPTSFNAVTGNVQRRLAATWAAPTGTVDIDWTPDPTTLAYFKYSRGYKSGGWSTYTLAPLPEVNPEYVDAFEIGAKKTIGREWTLNGDIFYYNYYGEQVPLSVVNQIGQIVPILYNIPLAHSYGLELWGTWRPTDALTVSLSYSHLNAKVAQSACVLDTVDPLAIQPGANTSGCIETPADIAAGTLVQNIHGQYIPGATPNKISLNGLYTWNFDPGKLTLSGTFIWRDGTYDSVFNRAWTFQPSSTQVNVRATWTDKDGRYNIILFCNNLFDTTAYDGAGGTLLGTFKGQEDILYQPFLNAPRTFGVQFQVRWK
ncbi:MAG TPA: TonB-dependent receptor [Caulobacteraceae bacterium]|nr:TonB-dependent receptor [Caulobacteraceae bacterium]